MPDLPDASTSGPFVGRRGVVAGLAATGLGVSLAGCSTGIGTPSTQRTRTAQSRRDADLSPDEAAVVALVARLGASTRLLSQVSSRYPRLGGELTGLLAAEKEHRTMLARSADAAKLPARDVAAVSVPATREAARRAVLVDTRALRGTLFAAAGRAQSGQFARLLASMGCALSQRLAGLS